MISKLITAPLYEPISTEEFMEHMKLIPANVAGNELARYIQAARSWCEKQQNRSYIQQTWDFMFEDWPDDNEIRVPHPPLVSVTSIKYFDDADIEYTFAPANYNVDDYSEPGRIVLKNDCVWPTETLRTVKGIIIRFVSGYSDDSLIPPEIIQAILMLAGHLYEARTFSVEELMLRVNIFGVEQLLNFGKVDWF